METKGFFNLKSKPFPIHLNTYIMGLRPIIFWFFQCGDRLYASESDVYRRQILTYKDAPRTERVKTVDLSPFIRRADPVGEHHKKLQYLRILIQEVGVRHSWRRRAFRPLWARMMNRPPQKRPAGEREREIWPDLAGGSPIFTLIK